MVYIISRLLRDVTFYVAVLVLYVLMRDSVSDGAALLLTACLIEVYVLAIWVHLMEVNDE